MKDVIDSSVEVNMLTNKMYVINWGNLDLFTHYDEWCSLINAITYLFV